MAPLPTSSIFVASNDELAARYLASAEDALCCINSRFFSFEARHKSELSASPR